MNQDIDLYQRIYVNVTVSNEGFVPTNIEFSENRAYPILNDPQNWMLTIERFFLPGNQLALFDYSWLKGVKAVTIEDVATGIIGSANVLYTPEQTVYPTEQPYNSYQHFLDDLNVAFDTALVNLKALVAGITATPPYMLYDPATSLFRLRALANWYVPQNDGSFGNRTLRIWMSQNIYNFFSGIPANLEGFETLTGKDYWIPIKNIHDTNLVKVGGVDHLEMWSEQNTNYLWSQLQRVLIGTRNMPVAAEYLFQPNKNEQIQILTDFEPLVSQNPKENDVLQFFPQGPLRWINLLGNQPLYNVDLQVYWQDRTGQIFPLRLQPGRCATLKILFQRKQIIST